MELTREEFLDVMRKVGADIQEQFAQIYKHFDEVDKRFDEVDKRLDELEVRVDRLETNVRTMQRDVKGIKGKMDIVEAIPISVQMQSSLSMLVPTQERGNEITKKLKIRRYGYKIESYDRKFEAIGRAAFVA